MLQMPMALGTMRDTTTSEMCDASQRARAPTHWCAEITASIKCEIAQIAVDQDVELGLAHERFGRNPGRHQRGRDPGQRSFDHARKDIVGAGRDRHQRNIAATFGDHPVGAVATERDQCAYTQIGAALGGLERVSGVSQYRHGQRIEHAIELDAVSLRGERCRRDRAGSTPARRPVPTLPAARAGRC